MTSKKWQPMIEVPPSTEYVVLDARGAAIFTESCPAEAIRRGRRAPHLKTVCVIGAPTGTLIAHIFHGRETDIRPGQRAQATWRSQNATLVAEAMALAIRPKTSSSALSAEPELFSAPDSEERRSRVDLERKLIVYTAIHLDAEEPFWAPIGVATPKHDGSIDIQLASIPMNGSLTLRQKAEESKVEEEVETSPPLDAPLPLDAEAPPPLEDATSVSLEVKPSKTVLQARRDRKNERRREKRRLAREAKAEALEARPSPLAASVPPAPLPVSAAPSSSETPDEARARRLQARRDRKNERRRNKRRLAREAKAQGKTSESSRESGVHVNGVSRSTTASVA